MTEPPKESEVEPITGAGAAAKATDAAIEESQGLLRRVLGPSADEIGEYLRARTRAKVDKSLKVARNADGKLESSGVAVPGDISNRAALRIFDEAEYCGDDDEIVVEYLGGLLASSRVKGQGSDLGNTYAALVSRMAGDHLRTHYVIYYCLQRSFQGREINFYDLANAQRYECFIPFTTFESAFPDEIDDHRLYSSIFWLNREGLLGTMEGGSAESMGPKYPWIQPPNSGLVISGSSLGVELFQWGLGRPGNPNTFLQLDTSSFEVSGLDVNFAGVTVKPIDTEAS